VAASASPAVASSWRAGSHPPGAVALAGTSVEWLTSPGVDIEELFEAHGGSRPRLLQRFPTGVPKGNYDVGGFAGSPSGVAFERTCVGCNVDGGPLHQETQYFAGPVGGRLKSVERCPASGGAGLDVSGRALVFSPCGKGLEIDDLRGAPPVHIEAVQPFLPRIAGRYAAWIEGPYGGADPMAVVVYDRKARAEAYRIPASELPAQIDSLDVQDDGTIALSFEPDPRQPPSVQVGWASIAHPTLHRIPLPVRSYYAVKIAGDHVAFLRSSPSARRRQVGISDFAGHHRVFERNAYPTMPDLDGTEIAYAKVVRRGYKVVRIPVR
jgi:hypothetical protein